MITTFTTFSVWLSEKIAGKGFDSLIDKFKKEELWWVSVENFIQIEIDFWNNFLAKINKANNETNNEASNKGKYYILKYFTKPSDNLINNIQLLVN